MHYRCVAALLHHAQSQQLLCSSLAEGELSHLSFHTDRVALCSLLDKDIVFRRGNLAPSMCVEKNMLRLNHAPSFPPKPVVPYGPISCDAEGQAVPNLWLMACLQTKKAWTFAQHCYRISTPGVKT